jgi:outer membrane protein OmpA-like peptidoglycan-associated protein
MHSIRRILIFLAVFALFQTSPLKAQEQDKEQSKAYLEQAQLMREGSMAFDDIRDVMVLAADFDTTNIKANFDAGDLYIRTINRHQSTKYFMRIYRQMPEYRFDLEYWIGLGYQFGLEFDKALNYYTKYRDKVQKRASYQGKDKMPLKEVERRIYECQNGKEFVASPKNYSIINIGREINSEFEDYAPVFNEDETEVIFTTRRRDGNMNENVFEDNKPWEDIFYAKKNGNAWVRAQNLGTPVTTPTHESSLYLAPDGNTLYIYLDEGKGDIFFSEQKNGKWSEPEPLPGIINSSYTENSVSITQDGNTMYFSSERPGGLGGLDLYVCTKDAKGAWSKVKNLGPGINTEYDDEGAFISADGKTLHFSSRGRKGMGGHDIFKSVLQDAEKGVWSEPENVGYPINTPDDDIYFVESKDGKRGYYSSVRDDGMGYSDIYRIEITPEKKPEPVKTEPEPVKEEPKKEEPKPEPAKEEPKKEEPKKEEPKPEPKKEIIPLKYQLKIVDAASKSPLDAKVKLQGLKDNVVVGVAPAGAGIFEFSITSTTPKDYTLSVEREGYIFQNIKVNIAAAGTQAKTMSRTIEMRKIAIGVSSILRNIYFDFGMATFKEVSYNELNKLENMMKQNAGMQVEISGHTDNVGGTAANKRLSQLRANAVKNFLTSKGIDARRITAVGFGEEKPLATNDDETEGREINRRVEFKVIGN